jgi:hypothetical protein
MNEYTATFSILLVSFGEWLLSMQLKKSYIWGTGVAF